MIPDPKLWYLLVHRDGAMSMNFVSTIATCFADKQCSQWSSPWMRRSAWGMSCLFLGILFAYPALADISSLGSANDWDQHLLYHWVPYVSVIEHGEFSTWNPWACGGTPLLANPQTRYLSPFFLLHLATGPVAALHLEIVLHLAIMAAGGWFLAREFGMRWVGRAAVTLIFLGTSAHYLHLAMGHTWALSYAYLPWILAFTWRAKTSSLWSAMIVGALLALMICEGGIYPAPQAALLVVLVCFGIAIKSQRWHPVAVAAVAGITAVGLSAPKLLPTLRFMWQFPRTTEALESTSLPLLFDSLFARDQFLGRAVPEQADGLTWGFHEYGAYVGPAALLLVIAALLLSRRRALGMALLAGIFLALACGRVIIGDSFSLGLWQLLHELPPFASQHVPSRFLVPFVLCFAVLAGFGADALQARYARRGLFAALALVLVGALDSWMVGPPNLWRMYDSPQGADVPGEFHHEWWGDTNLMMPLVLSNRGALHCYESVYLPIAASMPGEGFKGEEYLADGGEIRRTYWGPSALDFEIRDGPATVLVVNQNFHSGWTMEHSQGQVFSLDGVLAAEVPAGTTRVSLRHRSSGFRFGLLLACLTLLAGFWVRRRERRMVAGP